MSKSIKVLSIVLIMFSFIVSFYGVYATDINMNLPTVDQPSNITSLDNDQNIEQSVEDIVPSTVNVNTSSNTAEIQPSNVSSIVEEGLGITSILSILLITVGVILILLAIAIIIRLK